MIMTFKGIFTFILVYALTYLLFKLFGEWILDVQFTEAEGYILGLISVLYANKWIED